MGVDADGAPFINYLGVVDEIADDEEVIEHLDNHRRHVVARLNEHENDDRIRPKYGWLANYHDRFCRSEYSENPDLLIDASGTEVLAKLLD